jgi:putative membrane protein
MVMPPVSPTTPLWLAWDFEPLPLLALVALSVVYTWALGPGRTRLGGPDHADWSKAAFFYTGVFFLAVALLSPLDFLGMHYLLSAHMAQHVIFSVVSPPLLLLGTPAWMASALVARPRVRQVARWLTHPVIAFGLYNLNMWFWHIPAVLDATTPSAVVVAMSLLDNAALVGALLFAGLVALPWLLRRQTHRVGMLASAAALVVVLALTVAGSLNIASWSMASQPHNPIHTLMNALFIMTGILYWCPILNPAPELPRLSALAGMVYMFISTQPMMALGAIITFSAHPLYAMYQQAPLLGGFTRLGDQQLAGLTMWLLMDIPLLLTLSILFFRWMREQERKELAGLGDLSAQEELFWAQQRTASAASAGSERQV